MRLEYLNCPQCGAPTPLLGSRQVECVYCAALIDVPPHIQTPILEFQLELLALKQRAFQPYVDPGKRLSNALVLSMALFVYVYLFWWWNSSVPDWSSLEPSTRLVLLDLLALPPALILLNRLFSSGEGDYFRKAKLAFANLTFDLTTLAKAQLSCARCAAPLNHKETRDIVIRCRHCDSELLIPSLLLSEQLQGVFKRVMALRGKGYNRYAIMKWALIAATAFNAVFPIFLLANSAVRSMHLIYLTGFAWAYMFNWLCTLWAYRELNTGYAVGMFVLLVPLPAFFLFQMTRVLLGLDPNSF